MKARAKDDFPYAGDLYGELTLEALPPARDPVGPIWPGLALCGIAALAATWLSEHYGMPVILLGLLIGLALNFASADVRTHRGLDFASRTFLRVGIVILGTQVTFAQIVAMGLTPFAALLLVMAAAFAGGLLGARATGQSVAAGILAGGATAICGASAALALYAVIGKDRISQAQFALTLVGITLFSALALSFYPLIAGALSLGDRQAGFLIGAAVHDVAQAIGAGFAFSDAAGADATVVKLARVALLAPVVALVSLAFSSEDSDGSGSDLARPIWRRLALPWFIIAFLALVSINSLAPVPAPVAGYGLTISKTLLLLAVTATAMRSRMDLLIEIGWRALGPVFGATFASLITAICCAVLLY
jgi:uncharacterized integral membrane protein (TIGR00698 family)